MALQLGSSGCYNTTTTGACRVICRKETVCDFCHCTLPDWQRVFTPACGMSDTAILQLTLLGQDHTYEVLPGPAGYQNLQRAMRMAHALPPNTLILTSFTGDDPTEGTVFALSNTKLQNAAANSKVNVQGYLGLNIEYLQAIHYAHAHAHDDAYMILYSGCTTRPRTHSFIPPFTYSFVYSFRRE